MELTNVKVFGEDGQFHDENLYTDQKLISEKSRDSITIDGEGCYVIPGLVDIHFHGCDGHDFCEGTLEAMEKIAQYELSQGITSICPATMTFAEEKLSQICSQAAVFQSDKGTTLCGINLEGPFISEAKKGAQNPKYIRKPDIAMFRRLQETAKGLIKLVDIACESEGAMEFIEELKGEVRISLAHTTANYEMATMAFVAGAKHVTHLYNAMLPYTHREPGVVGAACDVADCMVELICDGVHIHPSVIRTTFKMFGDDRICLISDSMMATGMPDGDYSLGGQHVKVLGRNATLEDGTLAGSVTNLMECMKTAVKNGIKLESAVKCATVNPAKAIGVFDKYGSCEVGKVANLVLLDANLQIKKIIFEGKIWK